ncbi:MAG: pyridoxal phosphate-dependent class II aminotransferase, partial [Desulfatitalea sp.]|nr:pyridoxal phosphate-dependent class II aminotransferase [Desulfatitalea sp.]
MIQGHGGNIYALARKLGCSPADIDDLSSNINPLGPPPGLIDHLKARMTTVRRLPEVDGFGATAQMADMLG